MEATPPSSFHKRSCVTGSDKALYHEAQGGRRRARYAPMTCKVDYEGQIFRILMETSSQTAVYRPFLMLHLQRFVPSCRDRSIAEMGSYSEQQGQKQHILIHV